MTRAISLSIIALVAALAACGVEPARGPAPGDDPGSPQVDEQAVTSGDTADPASSTSPTNDAITPRANGCSIVEFCNVPNSPEGTRCRQQAGCTIPSALNECKAEGPLVCGTPVQPWVFVTTDGVHHSCRLQNRCGNFTVGEACQCDSFCTTAGDCCPDGPC